MPPALVALDAVAVRRSGALILRSIDLSLEPGEVLGVHGTNGSGKTTLLRLLATLEAPDQGSGQVLGSVLGSPSVEAIRARIGLVGHTAALADELTLLENLALFAALFGLDRPSAVSALGHVGLAGAADRRAAVCSHGMRKRADLARVAMAEPLLLLLDEPHVGLDADATHLVDRVVGEVTGRGGAAVLVSHDSQPVARLVTRSVRLRDGTLTEGRG